MNKLVRYLWTKSPRDYWQWLTSTSSQYGQPWATGKHANANRLVNYLLIFNRCAASAGHELRYSGARVVEIGAGPVLGLIPFLLVEGAGDCAIIEPGYREIRHDERFSNEYLFNLFATHSKLLDHPGCADYATFLERINRVRIEATTLESFPVTGDPFDIVLSKSCFEHIVDVPSAARIEHSISAPGSLHLHYIDFTMHYARDREPDNPFGQTYRRAKSENPEYHTSPGGIVNLLRPCDMVEAFRAHFSEVHFFPLVDYAGRLNVETLHADWKDYAAADLTVANGVLVAVH